MSPSWTRMYKSFGGFNFFKINSNGDQEKVKTTELFFFKFERQKAPTINPNSFQLVYSTVLGKDY